MKERKKERKRKKERVSLREGVGISVRDTYPFREIGVDNNYHHLKTTTTPMIMTVNKS